MKQSVNVETPHVAVEDHKVKVSGPLTFDTVCKLRKQVDKIIMASTTALEFDLQEVKRIDSSALALLIAWVRLAQQNKSKINFTHLPQPLIDLAKLGRLSEILGLYLLF